MSGNDGVLLEDINHNLRAILEGQAAMAHVPKQISKIVSQLKDVTSDIKIIKAVVTNYSGELRKLDTRVTKLEQVVS